MKPEELIKALNSLEKLKFTLRHSWTSSNRPESVAEHCWRLSVFAWLISCEIPDLNLLRLIKMCLIHDLGEAITGDIPSFQKSSEDDSNEMDAVNTILAAFPEEISDEVKEIFEEISSNSTREAKLFSALDRMEAVIQHNEAPLETWLPLEHELNLSYGETEAQEFSYTRELRETIKTMTQKKLGGGDTINTHNE